MKLVLKYHQIHEENRVEPFVFLTIYSHFDAGFVEWTLDHLLNRRLNNDKILILTLIFVE